MQVRSERAFIASAIAAETPVFPSSEVGERTAAQVASFGPLGERDWPALIRLLDREMADYRD